MLIIIFLLCLTKPMSSLLVSDPTISLHYNTTTGRDDLVQIFQDSTRLIDYQFILINCSNGINELNEILYQIVIKVLEIDTAPVIMNNPIYEISRKQLISSNCSYGGEIVLAGDQLGHFELMFGINIIKSTKIINTLRYIFDGTIIRNKGSQDLIATILLVIITGINFVTMGMHLDFKVIKHNLMRPRGPLIALFLQFGALPLVSLFLN